MRRSLGSACAADSALVRPRLRTLARANPLATCAAAATGRAASETWVAPPPAGRVARSSYSHVSPVPPRPRNLTARNALHRPWSGTGVSAALVADGALFAFAFAAGSRVVGADAPHPIVALEAGGGAQACAPTMPPSPAKTGPRCVPCSAWTLSRARLCPSATALDAWLNLLTCTDTAESRGHSRGTLCWSQ